MPFVYRHEESSLLTSAQKTDLASLVSGIWPGSLSEIEGVSFTRSGENVLCQITGEQTVPTKADLPDPPVTVLRLT